MKFTAALLGLLLFTSALLRAEEVTSILSADGKTVDADKLQKFVEWVEPWVHEYPVRFENDAQKQSILTGLRKVTDEIQKMDVTTMTNVDQLTTLGFVLAMGHNADLRTATKAHMFFQRALTLDPGSRRANFLYGLFLMGTDKYHFDSLPFLEKSLGLGERDAQYYIALLYYQKGDKAKAVQQMETYIKARPDMHPAKKVLESMKNGSLSFTTPDNTPPPAAGGAP